MAVTEDMARPLSLTLIAAVTRSNGLGVNGALPWKLPKEMAHFRKATLACSSSAQNGTNAVIMGRKTWESIPTRFRPLKGRINVVVSRSPSSEAEERLGIKSSEQTYLVASLQSAVNLLLDSCPQLSRTFLIGGAQLYSQAMQATPERAVLDRLLITRILEPAFEECDVHLPEFRSGEQVEQEGKPEVDQTGEGEWRRCSSLDLNSFVGEAVEKGEVEEKGVRYELQMWEKSS